MTSLCCWRLSGKFAVTVPYATVSGIVTYIAGGKKKRRKYSSVWLAACVFVFMLWSVVAFLFRVLCETERLPENDSLKPDPAVR